MRVGLWRHFRGVQEPLVAHVAFAAAEVDVGSLLPLHALITAEDTEVGIRKQPQEDMEAISAFKERSHTKFLKSIWTPPPFLAVKVKHL